MRKAKLKNAKKRCKVINNKKEIYKYSNMLSIIQDENFKSKKLLSIQKGLVSSNINCKNEMKKLKNIFCNISFVL